MSTTESHDVSPLDLQLKRKSQELLIRWRDGRETRFPLAFLRGRCPCATCRSERERGQRTRLPILSIAPGQRIEVVNAELMGNYAVQLIWSDGHDTGIFDYSYLRSLEADLPTPRSDSA